MPDSFYLIISVYLIIINIISAVVTIADKRKAISGKWRIPESTLMLLGLFGGAALEYITMKAIRHKTKHMKFMVGLPIMIFFILL